LTHDKQLFTHDDTRHIYRYGDSLHTTSDKRSFTCKTIASAYTTSAYTHVKRYTQRRIYRYESCRHATHLQHSTAGETQLEIQTQNTKTKNTQKQTHSKTEWKYVTTLLMEDFQGVRRLLSMEKNRVYISAYQFNTMLFVPASGGVR
jgi:hypothetical protein